MNHSATTHSSKILTAESLDEQTLITELTIMPDGRIFVFGTSRAVLEILEGIGPGDESLRRLLTHVRRIEKEIDDHGSNAHSPAGA